MILLPTQHNGFQNDLNDAMQLLDDGMVLEQNATYVQPLHGADLPAGLHGLVDLLVERLPVVEGTDLQELEQRVQLFDAVLPADVY